MTGSCSLLLQRFAAALSKTPGHDEALRLATRWVAELVPSSRVTLVLMDPDRPDHFRVVALEGDRVEALDEDLALAGTSVEEAIAAEQTLLRRRLADHLEKADLRTLHEAGMGSVVHVPLLGVSECLGSLNAVRTGEDAFDERDVEVLQGLGLVLGFDLVHRRDRQRTEQALQRAQTIVDCAVERFLLLSPEGRVELCSRDLQEALGRRELGLPLWAYFEHDPGFAEQLEVGWEALLDGSLPAAVALRQLPRTVRCGGQTFALDFRPVREVSEGGRLAEVVVVVRDAAEDKARAADQEVIAAFRHYTRDPASFSAFVREADRMVADIAKGASSALQLHTFKGNATVMGATSVARAVHRLEGVHVDVGPGPRLEVERSRVVAVWAQYKARLEELIGLGVQDAVGLRDDEYRSFRERVRTRAPELLPEVDGWRLERLDARLEKLLASAGPLAGRLGKPEPEVELVCEPMRLDPDRYGPLWRALIHPLRNAVDHGLETEADRRAAGKPPRGRISIHAERSEDGAWLQIELRDDGAGVDWTGVRRAAGEPTSDVESHSELAALLFTQPISTKQAPTEVSGRGLGLSALAEVAEALGGSVQLDSYPGCGTLVKVRVPAPVASPEPTASPQDLVARVEATLEACDGILGARTGLPPDLSLEERLEYHLVRVQEQARRAEALEGSLLAVTRHYEQVRQRVARIADKAASNALELSAELQALAGRLDDADRLQGAVVSLIMRLQRQDIQQQELANLIEAIELLMEYLDANASSRYAKLVELPFVLETLLPRADIDARDVAPAERGPAVELF